MVVRYILGLYWDNGKHNGNCYLAFRVRVHIVDTRNPASYYRTIITVV